MVNFINYIKQVLTGTIINLTQLNQDSSLGLMNAFGGTFRHRYVTGDEPNDIFNYPFI